jgi:hypothetical protein
MANALRFGQLTVAATILTHGGRWTLDLPLSRLEASLDKFAQSGARRVRDKLAQPSFGFVNGVDRRGHASPSLELELELGRWHRSDAAGFDRDARRTRVGWQAASGYATGPPNE